MRVSSHPGSPSVTDRADEKQRQAIAAIIANCGKKARKLLHCGHPYLTPKIITQIANTSSDRQRVTIEEVRQGRRPFSTKTTVFDTTEYKEVGSRLSRGGGWVNKAAQVTAHLMATGTPSAAERIEIQDSARRLLCECATLWRLIRTGYRKKPPSIAGDGKAFRWNPPRKWGLLPDSLEPGKVCDELNRVTSWVEKCVRDIPRLGICKLWPSREATHSFLVRLYEMISDLKIIINITTGGNPAHDRRWQMTDGRKRVATHKKPDVDALTAVWLVERFLFKSKVEVIFLDYQHDWLRGPRADCVVDMAGLHYPRLLLFDHKLPSREDKLETCATRLVWEYLIDLGTRVAHLEDLVHTVHAGDSPSKRRLSTGYQDSKREGLHARHSDAKRQGMDDLGLYHEVRSWLNRYDKRLH